MRRKFVEKLDNLMEKDNDIYLLTVDVGFGVLDPLKEKYKERFINVGIAEQNAVSMATGLALKGKKPFVYSISSFLVFRATEQIRMLSSMNQHVVLTGVGKEDEYTNFGLTHYTHGDIETLSTMPNLKILTPENKEDVGKKISEAYEGKGPYYLRLSRF